MPDILTARWTEQQHQVAELEVQAAYAAGFAAGRAADEEDLRRWAEDFCDSAPGATAVPLETRRAAIVRSLVDRALIGTGMPAPASRTNGRTWSPHPYQCGPVPIWGDDE
ncbi:MAG: hypothetical protein ACRDT2_02480 [Natronosporangium sp.]